MLGHAAELAEPVEGEDEVVPVAMLVVVVGVVAVDELVAALAITAPPPARAPATIAVASPF